MKEYFKREITGTLKIAKARPLYLLVILACAITFTSVHATEVIRSGDYLSITVIGSSGFDRVVRVQDDGTVAYPFITDIPVVDMTHVELQSFLLQVMQKYLDNPVVLVEVLSQYTVNIQVLGQVNRPGILTIPVGLDVQSALSLAGGATEFADLSKIHVLRKIKNGATTWNKISADLNNFLTTGDISSLPKLQEDDIIMVPGASATTYVTVIGAVVRPGNYVPHPDSDVLQIVLQSGGMTQLANGRKVKLLRLNSQGKYERIDVNLDKLIDKDRINEIPSVKGGDIIVIPDRTGLITWDNALKLIRDFTVLASLYIVMLRLK